VCVAGVGTGTRLCLQLRTSLALQNFITFVGCRTCVLFIVACGRHSTSHDFCWGLDSALMFFAIAALALPCRERFCNLVHLGAGENFVVGTSITRHAFRRTLVYIWSDPMALCPRFLRACLLCFAVVGDVPALCVWSHCHYCRFATLVVQFFGKLVDCLTCLLNIVAGGRHSTLHPSCWRLDSGHMFFAIATLGVRLVASVSVTGYTWALVRYLWYDTFIIFVMLSDFHACKYWSRVPCHLTSVTASRVLIS
jgi:hypothetical protein